MAQLPTPSISGSFTSTSRVQGTTAWDTASNLSDLDEVRVRYARIGAGTSSAAPSRTDLMNGSARTTWGTFSSGGRTYGYKDDVITSGFASRSVAFSESALSGYNVWAMSRLEA